MSPLREKADAAGGRGSPGRRMGFLFAPVAVGTLLADLLTKWLAFNRLDPVTPLPVIRGVLNLRLSTNPGAVFGIGKGMGGALALFTVLAAAAVIWAAWTHGRSSLLLTWGLAVLLGGALGNLWDRLAHGSVRDFIDLYAGSRHWPTFNVADMAICVGAGLVILYSLRTREPKGSGSR